MEINKKIGKFGEDVAAKYLIKNGYSILARNHKEKFDEIDIVARRFDGVLIFCEVKTVKLNFLTFPHKMTPEDHMNFNKIKKLVRASNIFAAKYPWLVDEEKGWQIDLIAVTIAEGRTIDINHYENV